MPVASADGIGGIPFGPSFVDPGGSDGGFGGSFAATISSVQGVCVAFNDGPLVESPSWTRLDDPNGPWKVQGWRIDRGRTYEFDRTSTGTASITMVDTTGDFDPTDATAPYYYLTVPMKQAAIALRNPLTDEWFTVFRGFVSDWRFLMHPTQRFVMMQIDLVDALDVLAAAQVAPSGGYGDTVPAASEGDVYYQELSSATASSVNTNAVQTRINQVLDEIGWPAGLREIFSGNVKLQETVYPAGTSALSVIQDAADAEFPGVANVYVGRDGKVTFHGRFARFNYTEPQYHIEVWELGDDDTVAGAPSTYTRLVPPLEFHFDKEHAYSAAIATPQGIDDGDIAAQYQTDYDGGVNFGDRTWSAENLLTAGGVGTTAAQETAKFAQYYVANYAWPFLRVNQATVKAASTGRAGDANAWDFVCKIDISDRVNITTTHPNGGGFAGDGFFVEGVHYECKPMNGTHPEVVVTVDLSPAGFYSVNPF